MYEKFKRRFSDHAYNLRVETLDYVNEGVNVSEEGDVSVTESQMRHEDQAVDQMNAKNLLMEKIKSLEEKLENLKLIRIRKGKNKIKI
eukprot:snap_masked-scaffold_9-processed-gene-13.99-mRNA-1 protein AED:1.00 eAED:1.00 QI:0/-1/0/0/-1/1/1/0/87